LHFTLSDLITDITQNAAESGASLVELEVRETDDSSGKREFRFSVKDNGKGMDSGELERAKDPFVTDGKKHPNRKVGLGIPFFIQTAEQSGGGWDLQSKKDTGDGSSHGTTTTAWFDGANVDTPPVGDLPGMFRTVLLFEGPKEILIRRFRSAGEDYEVRKTELEEALGGFEDAGSLVLLDRYLRSLEGEEDDVHS
jgi:hypothetical protein